MYFTAVEHIFPGMVYRVYVTETYCLLVIRWYQYPVKGAHQFGLQFLQFECLGALKVALTLMEAARKVRRIQQQPLRGRVQGRAEGVPLVCSRTYKCTVGC